VVLYRSKSLRGSRYRDGLFPVCSSSDRNPVLDPVEISVKYNTAYGERREEKRRAEHFKLTQNRKAEVRIRSLLRILWAPLIDLPPDSN
jgi:hypothetical protein